MTTKILGLMQIMTKQIEKVGHVVDRRQTCFFRRAIDPRMAAWLDEPVASHAARLHGHHPRNQIVRQHSFLRERER